MATEKMQIVIEVVDGQAKATIAGVEAEMDKLGKTSKQASSGVDSTTSSIDSLKIAAAALAAIGIGKTLAEWSDGFTKLNAQLHISTTNQTDFNAAMENVQRIARTAQVDINDVGAVYYRLSAALKDAGYSQAAVGSIAETVALSLKIGGASAQESAAAMLQLSQAFASGRLQGDEFRSMMEAAPNLMRALAASMDVPIGQLKTLGAEGKITSQELLQAFSDPKLLESLREQAKTVETISGKFTNLWNEVKLTWQQFDKASGSSDFLSAKIGGLSEYVANLRRQFEYGNWWDKFAALTGGTERQYAQPQTFAPTAAEEARRATLTVPTTPEDTISDAEKKRLAKLAEIKQKAEQDMQAAHISVKQAELATDIASSESITSIQMSAIETDRALKQAQGTWTAEQEVIYQDTRLAIIQGGYEREMEMKRAQIDWSLAQDIDKYAREMQDRIDKGVAKDKAQILFDEQKKVRKEEVDRQLTELEINKQSAMTKAAIDGANARAKAETDIAKFGRQIREGDYSSAMDTAAKLSAGLAKHSRAAFEVNKAASLASAVIKGYQAATAAWAAGMETGGPWAPAVAAAYTAASIATTAAQIQAIQSASFGGGAAASPSVGGTAGTVPSTIGTTPAPAPAQTSQAASLTVNVSAPQGLVDPIAAQMLADSLAPHLNAALSRGLNTAVIA